MAFCPKCGKELFGTDVCECEQTVNTMVTTPFPGTTPSIKDDCLNILKKTLSPKPDDVITEAIYSKNHIWAVFGGLYVLLSAFAMMWIFEGLIKGSLRAMLGPVSNMAT